MSTSHQEVNKKNKRASGDYEDRSKNNNKATRGDKWEDNNIASRTKKEDLILYFGISGGDSIIANTKSKETNRNNKGNKELNIKEVKGELEED